jgi:hypothetical protein
MEATDTRNYIAAYRLPTVLWLDFISEFLFVKKGNDGFPQNHHFLPPVFPLFGILLFAATF